MLGHRQIVFKSDRENPVKAVSEKELAARRPEMTLENSPKYHSAANGVVESNWVEQGAEGRAGGQHQAVEPNTAVMTFMVNHAATIIDRFSVDQDGQTPMEKARGTTANRELAVPAHDEVQQDKQTRLEMAVRALHGCGNENEEDHGEQSQWK